ncbi:hypothetical protein ACIQMR_18930 [Streptomyces sp. NPDC091376]|uniref:hypothetical protein n=1 Tax=Streptomyces sp. NPDC091376 TaxID=3365994 RepID=UPI00380C93FE
MPAQQLGDGSTQAVGVAALSRRTTQGARLSARHATLAAPMGARRGSRVLDQSFQVAEQLLGPSQPLAQGPEAGALATDLPSAREELLVLRHWQGDRFHSSYGDA